MTIGHQNRLRMFFAGVCLVTVVVLYAPLGAAAWSLYSHACCTTGQCPIHGHRHQPSPATSEDPMDCGHHTAAMSMCKMSCCHQSDRPALAPVVFVLPPAVAVSAPSNLKPLVTISMLQKDLRLFEPPSPPPRFFPAAA